ncbi:MAG: efflux transporter periplasmic adaptor subunit, partial [Acidovorax sp.]
MNPHEEVHAPVPPPAVPPEPPRAPRPRRRWMGSVLALLLVALVGGAAWYLVKRANDP